MNLCDYRTYRLSFAEWLRYFISAAGAAAAAAYRLGYVEPRINVNQPGGMIQIDIAEDGTIFMTGTVGYIAEMTIAEEFFS